MRTLTRPEMGGSHSVRNGSRGNTLNGSESLVATLATEGVDICFANPGTSEMHFLAALENPSLRSVLVLFEGIATGAADGWYRMKNHDRRPRCCISGPGLANGLANIHNARRAGSGMVNIVGEHSTAHLKFRSTDCTRILRGLRARSATGSAARPPLARLPVMFQPPSQSRAPSRERLLR